MKTRTKTAGALASTLAAGAIAGGLLFSPVVSGAQDSTTTTTAPAEEGATATEDRAAARDAREAEREERTAAMAEVLGITVDELHQAREDGQTLAQIAEANGVDVQTVIDHIVAEQTAELEARIAELPTRAEAIVNGDLPEHGRGGHHGPGGPMDGPPPAGAPDADGGTEGGG